MYVAHILIQWTVGQGQTERNFAQFAHSAPTFPVNHGLVAAFLEEKRFTLLYGTIRHNEFTQALEESLYMM